MSKLIEPLKYICLVMLLSDFINLSIYQSNIFFSASSLLTNFLLFTIIFSVSTIIIIKKIGIYFYKKNNKLEKYSIIYSKTKSTYRKIKSIYNLYWILIPFYLYDSGILMYMMSKIDIAFFHYCFDLILSLTVLIFCLFLTVAIMMIWYKKYHFDLDWVYYELVNSLEIHESDDISNSNLVTIMEKKLFEKLKLIFIKTNYKFFDFINFKKIDITNEQMRTANPNNLSF